jgi:pyridoxal biosynthesis lyase PdxS
MNTTTTTKIAAAELRYADAVAHVESVEAAIRKARRCNKEKLWALANDLEQARTAVWQAYAARRAAYAEYE